jgi:hypothetical protein
VYYTGRQGRKETNCPIQFIPSYFKLRQRSLPDLAVLIPCLLPSWYRLVIQGVQLKGRQETPPTADLKPCNTRLRYGALDFGSPIPVCAKPPNGSSPAISSPLGRHQQETTTNFKACITRLRYGALDFGSPIPVCAEPPNGSSPAISSPLGRHRQETTTNFKTCITRLISGSGLWTFGRLFPYVPNLRTGSSPAISSPLGRHLRQLFRDFRGSDGHPVYTVTDANISVKVFFALLTVWNTAMYCMYVRTYLPTYLPASRPYASTHIPIVVCAATQPLFFARLPSSHSLTGSRTRRSWRIFLYAEYGIHKTYLMLS